MPTWSACPVCANAASGDPWVEMPPLKWHHCRSCDLVFKTHEPDGFMDDDHYEEDYFSGGSRQYDRRREHRVRKATRQINAGQEFTSGTRLLDIGCSLGYALEAGRRLGLDPVGLDLSETARRACHEQGFEAVDGSMNELPFEVGRFDLVLMKHVLEHTPDPARALREVHRVTTPGACLMIAVPNLHYIKGRFAAWKHRYYNPNHAGREHYVYFSPAALTRLLEAQGFTVRARSKAVFRRRLGRRGFLPALRELSWFSLLWLWQGIASVLSLRREIFVVAQHTTHDDGSTQRTNLT